MESAETPTFTAHNIRLDDGTLTRPDAPRVIDDEAWCVSAKRVLGAVFQGDRSRIRIADLGCLEGGFSVAFARMGFHVLGLEVREANIAACRWVKAHTNLPNLEFVCDNVWNVERHGPFDGIFCGGLLYHLEEPRRFLQLLGKVTKRLLIVQTHFAEAEEPFPRLRRLLGRKQISVEKWRLSDVADNESLKGRWFLEYESDATFTERERYRWSAWDNRRSFWIQREYLLDAIAKAGFDLVMEQFDHLGANIAHEMLDGYYKTDSRSTFIGLKTV